MNGMLIAKASAVAAAIGVLAVNTQPAMAAGTVASRVPQCMTVTDSTIVNFLNKKVAAWLFVDHCTQPISFYYLPPGGTWQPYRMNALQSLGFIAAGGVAKQVKVLECPQGSTASGYNSNVCYK